jgi:hypothetical protein
MAQFPATKEIVSHMFKRIREEILKYFHQESLAERNNRMLPGAVYCAITVAFYVIVSAVINVIFFPDLHLAVNWIGLLVNCIEYGIAMALAGAIVGWFTEDHEGIVWGGVVLAILLLVGNLVASMINGRGATLMGQSIIITFLPVVGAGILLAWVIRMAIKRHFNAKQQANTGTRRKLFVQLVSLVSLVGLILGVFSLYGSSSLSTIRSLNTTLQNYATDPLLASRFPYEQVPSLKDHFGMHYSLYAHTSTLMTGSLDVTIRFEDGYSVTCLVPLVSGNEPLLLDVCNEGMNIRFP